MKTCRICHQEKQNKQMVRNKVFQDGLDTICLDCSRQKVKEWRKTNKRSHGNRKQNSAAYRGIIIDFLIKRDGLVCGICGETLEGSTLHINHIIPVALGGLDIMENVNLTHPICNMGESNRIRKESVGY